WKFPASRGPRLDPETGEPKPPKPDPRTGKPRRRTGRLNASTIWRWCRDGVLLPDGSRLRLEAVRLGGRWLTSEAAPARSAARQTPAPQDEQEGGEEPVVRRTPGRRRRDMERAEEELARRGL